MRRYAGSYSNAADLMWVLAVVSFFILLGVSPQVSATQVPYYGGSAAQLLVTMMPVALMMLVGFNLLSGRWPVAHHRRRNIWTARLACVALVAIAYIVFIVNKGVTGLPVLTFDKWTLDVDVLAKIGLFGTMAFAIIDAVFTKGDDYVASSVTDTAFNDLQQENANLRAQLSAARHAATAPAPVPTRASAGLPRAGDGFPFPIRPVILPAVYLRPGEQVPQYRDATPVTAPSRPATPVAEASPPAASA